MTKENNVKDWLIRFVKGMFIGSGFIIPGVSGGALAAIFGIYERIIRFLANLTKDFIDNIKYFLPIGFGALFGIALLSWGVSFLLGEYETITLWFFVGAIIGTLPGLWNEAGKQGRNQKDYIILAVSFIIGLFFLIFMNNFVGGQVNPSFGAWIACGVLIALGVLVPGLSPSNFIVIMGLYQAMADGFKTFDLTVIIPIALGGLITIILLAKVIEKIFNANYSAFYHFIIGIVLASTILIIPTDYSGFTLIEYILCLILLALGIIIGLWMTRLEETYK